MSSIYYYAPDLGEARRQFALQKALEVYAMNRATGIIELAGKFESFLEGEGERDDDGM